MRKETLKKYLYRVLTGFSIIALSILFFFIIFRSNEVGKTLKTLNRILRPFLYGAIMAYLLAPICNYLNKKFQKLLDKRIKNKTLVPKISDTLSIFLSFMFAVAILYTLFSLVIPQVYTSIIGIAEELPDNIEKGVKWVQKLLKDNPMIKNYIGQFSSMLTTNLQNWINTNLAPSIQSIINGFSYGVFGVIIFMKNFVIGIIVAVYILSNRVKFTAQAKKLLYSCFKVQHANAILEEVRFTNKVFGGFINGKLLDSLIIGIICFVVTTILKMPYAMLISVIVGVTNIIPFFGPFIGAIPSSILIFMVSPIQCLYFIIFIFILQQFDGNILGPKILGDTIGLDSFWVLFSILLFGGLYGFAGMILGVPTFAVIHDLGKKAINHSLKKKDLSRQRDDYEDLNYVDKENNKFYYSKDK